MQRETTHRGYSIRYRCSDEDWSAYIRRPGAFGLMPGGMVTATLDEGEMVLLRRVYERIDVDSREWPTPGSM